MKTIRLTENDIKNIVTKATIKALREIELKGGHGEVNEGMKDKLLGGAAAAALAIGGMSNPNMFDDTYSTKYDNLITQIQSIEREYDAPISEIPPSYYENRLDWDFIEKNNIDIDELGRKF